MPKLPGQLGELVEHAQLIVEFYGDHYNRYDGLSSFVLLRPSQYCLHALLFLYVLRLAENKIHPSMGMADAADTSRRTSGIIYAADCLHDMSMQTRRRHTEHTSNTCVTFATTSGVMPDAALIIAVRQKRMIICTAKDDTDRQPCWSPLSCLRWF